MSLHALKGAQLSPAGSSYGTELEAAVLQRVVAVGLTSSPVAQVSTVTVGTASNDATYTLTLSIPNFESPLSLTYVADSSATVTEVAAGLLAKIEASPLASGIVTGSANVGVLTLTAVEANTVVTITATNSGGANPVVATSTAAAAAGSYTFGRVVNLSSYSATDDAWEVSAATLPAAGTMTYVATYDTGATYAITVIRTNAQTGANQNTAASWAAGGDAATMATNAETAIETAISGSSVATTVDGSDVTIVITLPFPEEGISAQASASGGGGAEELAYSGATAIGASPAMGIVMDYGETPAPSFGTAATATFAGSNVPVGRKGMTVWVADPGETVTAGGVVYVETTAGATNGRMYASASATRDVFPGASWVFGGSTLADGTTGAAVKLPE